MYRGRKTVFRRIMAWLHLWLGLASGIVVIVVSITGCLFVFQKEITEATHKKMYFVERKQGGVLPLSVLNEKAQTALGKDQPIGNIVAYKDGRRAWEFMAYKMNNTSITYFGAVSYYRSAFIDPYTGNVTGIRDYKYDFFNIVKYLHWSLLFNTKYGQPVVGWATLIFVLLLLTGLVLWWPKKWSRAEKKQAFTVRWRARFKRLNYDLHNVLGFYSLLLALVLALTGMVFSFNWFSNLTYFAASGTTVRPAYQEIISVNPQKQITGNPLDIAFTSAIAALPAVDRIGLSPAMGKEGVIYAFGYKYKELYYHSDALQFDQYSGVLLNRRDHKEKNNGEKLIEMNYDIHVGTIGGLTGKIIAFIISFIAASLPVTGFLVWWGKRKKTAKKNVEASRVLPLSV